MKLFCSILIITAMIFVWAFIIISTVMGTIYVLKVGFKELFDIEILEKIPMKKYAEKLLGIIAER